MAILLSSNPISPLCKRQGGFTLIELVTVMILLGILTAVVAPRFASRDGFAEYAVRDQIISAYRLAQQRAMYDHSGNCYQLFIDASRFGPQRSDVFFGPVGKIDFIDDYSNISVTPAAAIYFDGLGNAFTADCGDTPTANPATLTIQPSGIQLAIYSTGYIKAL
ncbi:MAG: type II secretion system protein [Pseudomonadales bacterium]